MKKFAEMSENRKKNPYNPYNLKKKIRTIRTFRTILGLQKICTIRTFWPPCICFAGGTSFE